MSRHDRLTKALDELVQLVPERPPPSAANLSRPTFMCTWGRPHKWYRPGEEVITLYGHRDLPEGDYVCHRCGQTAALETARRLSDEDERRQRAHWYRLWQQKFGGSEQRALPGAVSIYDDSH